MTFPNQISTDQANAATVVNEEFGTLAPLAVYGKKSSTTTGLTWGYYGGRWGDNFAISDGTLTLSASSTNYVVVAKATGVISTSTSSTNWDNTTDYARVYKITTNASGVSGTPEPHQATIYGVHAGGGGGVGGSVDLTADVTGILPLANGGTGAALTDPNADRILFWDDSAGATAFLTPGTGLSITGTTLNASTGGDASTNTATSVVGEVALFADTTGKVLKRATGSGLVRLTSGVQSTSTVATADIDNDAVTYAKLQNISATARIIGRKTASAGDAEECTLSEVLDFIGSAAQGDILYRDSSGWARLAAGTSGHFLKTQGAGANPTWAAAAGGTAGKHAIYIAAGSMSPSVSGGCASLAGVASASNQPDIRTLDFDATTEEYAQFSVVMPKSWNEGTVTFKAHWSHASTTTNFGVAWKLQGVAISDDDAIAASYGTAVAVTDTGGTTNDLYTTSESSAITIAGTPAAEDMVYFRVYREPSNGSDTMAIDARLHGITLYVTTDAETDA